MAIVKITRNLLKQFYGIGATPTYSACGPFTKLTEENSPEIDDTAFIEDKNSSPTVTGYKNKWSFEAQVHEGDTVVDDLLAIARGQKVGSDCERSLVDVDMNKLSSTEGSYYARQFVIAVECTPPAGDPKSITKITGNFHQVGDLVEGLFAVDSKTFTAGTFTPATPATPDA